MLDLMLSLLFGFTGFVSLVVSGSSIIRGLMHSTPLIAELDRALFADQGF